MQKSKPFEYLTCKRPRPGRVPMARPRPRPWGQTLSPFHVRQLAKHSQLLSVKLILRRRGKHWRRPFGGLLPLPFWGGALPLRPPWPFLEGITKNSPYMVDYLCSYERTH